LRLARMERAARIWVNGRELGRPPEHGHLDGGHD
jgi:hypothetical protein